MKRLAVLLVVAAALVAAACAPVKQPPPLNSASFERAVAGEANAYRNANGVPSIGWSNALHDDAARTVYECAIRGWISDHRCHDFTPTPENLAWYIGCAETAERAHDVVWGPFQWAGSYGHRIFLLDQYGWPPKHAQGAAAICMNNVLTIAWAGA